LTPAPSPQPPALMPTYDYECDACGHTFELFQGINDPVQKKCPKCGKLKLRRLFGTGAAVVFKGSGFYQTDYRSDSYKQGAEKEKPASESKSVGKGESKGDSHTESKSPADTKTPPADPPSEKKKSKKSNR
ncbi:MAG: FmdB family zinc ribbon protein, partial [Pirellulales bacterium]